MSQEFRDTVGKTPAVSLFFAKGGSYEMDIRPLTKEQRRFAEENHHLVFTFLNQKDLPESAFYDVVIFGYLKAVQEYLTEAKICHSDSNR